VTTLHQGLAGTPMAITLAIFSGKPQRYWGGCGVLLLGPLTAWPSAVAPGGQTMVKVTSMLPRVALE